MDSTVQAPPEDHVLGGARFIVSEVGIMIVETELDVPIWIHSDITGHFLLFGCGQRRWGGGAHA